MTAFYKTVYILTFLTVIQTFKITANDIKSDNIRTNNMNTKSLTINNRQFDDTVGYIYINGFSLPMDVLTYSGGNS
jgi:hypothetical protein